ncbi:MAG: hypothetical protein UGF91_14105, partial [Dialister invisus]|nr:hypothetical protein [Dialister invisus]
VLNDGGREIVIQGVIKGSANVLWKAVRRHPERQRRIYYRGEESGKKIKAISCELSAKSAE